MKKYLFLIIILCINLYSFADSADSLKKIIHTTTDVNKKIDLYLHLSDYYLLGDTNKDIAIDSAYYLALKTQDKERIALCSFYKGSTLNFYSKYDSAAILLTKAIDIFTQLNDTVNLASSWGEKGNSFCYRALYDKCLDCFLKSLKYTEELKNKKFLGTVLNNIGNVYYFMGKDKAALEYYKKALNVHFKNNFKYGIALSSNNIGSYYLDNGILDSALYYFSISQKNAKEINYFEQLAETTANLARLFQIKNNLSKSKKYSLESIKLFKKINSLYGLSKAYLGYGRLLFEEKKYVSSRLYVDSCLRTSQNAGVTEFEKEAYLWKYRLDSVAGNYKKALFNLLIYNQLKDSLKSKEVEKQIANLQSVYELDKKDKENQLLKAQKAKQQIIIQRQRLITIFTFVALILFIGFVIVLIYFYKNQKKYNNKLKLKNEEILQQKEEIITQNDILIGKNKEIEAQKSILQKYKKNITDSINYAQRIQMASLPNMSEIKGIFKDFMLIYLPKDIISGDFYFYKKIKEHKHVIAVADCTGHGVPGALMSILNISILKEILRESPDFSAAQILERARKLVKSALKQNSDKKLINDGMDISLIIFNSAEQTINYAGANRDLVYFDNSKMKILKSNKQPVAAYIKERKFDDNTVKYSTDDVFYLFSDGYPDQMAEKNYAKFLQKNFKSLLNEIYSLKMNEQKEILLEKFEQHKGKNHQTDDITILGFKI